MAIFEKALRVGEGKKFREFEKNVKRINAFEPELELESDEELRDRHGALRKRALAGESIDDLLYESFAVTREAARRSLGQRHFDVQLIGGMVLHDGSIAEMRTGEGKTLTSTLPIVLNSLLSRDEEGKPARGKGVHLVTVNDYLARRDALWMKPIYDLLGVSTGILQSDDRDWEAKRAAYQADVTYGTNSEFGFDYLRDNLATDMAEKSQRGHSLAIVDEVDNILIDEARTPLIISGSPEQAADLYYKFAKLAPMMEPGKKPEGIEAKSKDFEADFDFEPDEKHKTVAVTERGVAKAEKFLGIDNMYRAEHGNLVNHLQQALKAESLYRRDKDYAVIDGEVKIIDEFTGRILEGRRWSEGLHQAIEAKEGVAIQEENQTVATITYQNYFRRYDKLGGMTGTALTEATEFMKIYELQVVEIPTNRPMVREDNNDQIYKTKDGKWAAVAREISERHDKGQPVLVGTISVEVSELLSEQLKKNGIKHAVLNAKPEYAEVEGETIAEAGRPGVVTIATNMAGRGVDIKLGGNPEHLTEVALRGSKHEVGTPEYDKAWDQLYPSIEAQVERDGKKVKEAGGLYILGTERHESRRIDNQLRGRSGRQGDPGESRFYLSAEDDLVRLFAGDRIHGIMNRFKIPDDQPMEAGILSKQIENAQKKVEEQNFVARKNVLKYDDVMNTQRLVIYDQRRRVLEGEDLSDEVREWITETVEAGVAQFTDSEFAEDWDLDGLVTHMQSLSGTDITAEELREEVDVTDRAALTEEFVEDALETYAEREQELGADLAREVERYIILQVVDLRWREHLESMDYLREGVHLRAFAQKDPLVEYRGEGHILFEELSGTIRQEVVFTLFHVSVQVEQPALEPMQAHDGDLRYEHEISAGADAIAAAGSSAATAVANPPARSSALPLQQQVVNEHKDIGRNDPCWCGSGKKFKKCHGA